MICGWINNKIAGVLDYFRLALGEQLGFFICARVWGLWVSLGARPGLAPAGDCLSCPRKKGSKESVLRSLCRGTRYAPVSRLQALRSNSHGKLDGHITQNHFEESLEMVGAGGLPFFKHPPTTPR